jgi:hypothetical protein
MANITLNYRGITGKRGTITIDDTQNILSIITAIVADEDPTLGVLTGNDYDIALERDTSITDVANGSDTISTHIVDGDTIICIDDKKNLTSTNTKEVRQLRKLRIASVKRLADGKANYTYDATALPDTYNGNAPGADDNPNPDGLLPKRPWVTGVVIAEPDTLSDAIIGGGGDLTDLQIWYDAADTATIIPNATDESQITQWTDKSNFAHNANPDGGSAKPTYENTTPKNGYGYIEFDGVDDRLTINPFTQLASATGWTMFVVAQKTDGAETTGVLTRTDFGDLRIELAATGSGVTVTTAGQTEVYASQSDTNWNAWTLVYEASQPAVFRKNGSTLTPVSAPNQDATLNASNNEMYIGGSASDVWPGNIAEVIMFSRTLTATEYGNVENYLSNKWDL